MIDVTTTNAESETGNDMRRETFPLTRSLNGLVLALCALTASTSGAAVPAAPAHPAAKAASGAASQPKATPRIDINSASKAQLKTLRGIGDAEADTIIKHRPYLTSTEIVTKAGLPAGVYVTIKRQIVAMPKTLPKPAKPVAKSSP